MHGGALTTNKPIVCNYNCSVYLLRNVSRTLTCQIRLICVSRCCMRCCLFFTEIKDSSVGLIVGFAVLFCLLRKFNGIGRFSQEPSVLSTPYQCQLHKYTQTHTQWRCEFRLNRSNAVPVEHNECTMIAEYICI